MTRKRIPPAQPRLELHCSFCGKYQSEVLRLVVGHDVAICDECVAGCQEIIAEHRRAVEIEKPR